NTERLQSQLTARDPGQVSVLLLLAAMAQKRAHCIHLSVAGSTVAARSVDFFKDHCSLHEAQPASAVCLRNQHIKPTSLTHGVHETFRVNLLLIAVAPVIEIEAHAELPHRCADVIL